MSLCTLCLRGDFFSFFLAAGLLLCSPVGLKFHRRVCLYLVSFYICRDPFFGVHRLALRTGLAAQDRPTPTAKQKCKCEEGAEEGTDRCVVCYNHTDLQLHCSTNTVAEGLPPPPPPPPPRRLHYTELRKVPRALSSSTRRVATCLDKLTRHVFDDLEALRSEVSTAVPPRDDNNDVRCVHCSEKK